MTGTARGILSSVQAWYETTYGVQPASPATELLYYTSFKPSASIAQLIDATMSGGYRGELAPMQGNTDITGQIATVLAPQSAAKHLAMLIGTPTITNLGTGKNQMVFNAGGGMPVGLGFELNFGSQIATPGRYLRYNGCRYSKGAFQMKPDGMATATYDIIGSSLLWTPTSSINATPTDYGHTAFSMFNAAMTEGGGAIATVQQLDFTIDNNLDNSMYCIGGGGVRAELPEGMFKISGTLKALFRDVTLLNKALANTSTSLGITWTKGAGDGSAGNESLNFNIPNLAYKLAAPTIDGPKGISATLTFAGFRVGGAEQAFAATVKAARALA